MEINENNFRVVMLKGAKGDAYDDTQLRQDIDEKLANVPYVLYSEDDGFQLPIYTLNDDTISAYSTWSSEKINDTYPTIKYTITNDTITCNKTFTEIRDILFNGVYNINIALVYNNVISYAKSLDIINPQVTAGFVLKFKNNQGTIKVNHTPTNEITYTENPEMSFGIVFKNELSGTITKDALDNYTAFNVYLGKVTNTDYQYDYFKALDEYTSGNLSAIKTPYTVRFTGESLTDASKRTEIRKLDLTFGDFKVQKNENNEYLLYLDWYVKSGVTYDLPNGIFILVTPFFRPIYTD